MKSSLVATFGLDEFILANRRASRLEEIERHGRPVQFRSAKHSFKKAYSRKEKHPKPLY